MAHDISFSDADNEDEPFAFFFGYARGIFYTAFEAEHLDNGMSGANEGVTRSAAQVRQAIATIKASPVFTTYSDPDRIPEVIRELEAFLERNQTDGFLFTTVNSYAAAPDQSRKKRG